MTILKIPTKVAVSPQGGSPLIYDTWAGQFEDSYQGFAVHELVGTRQWNAIEKWLREQFPQEG